MIDPGVLTCQEFVEMVTDYLEGVMPAVEQERFAAHIADCPPCLYYLEQIRQTIHTLGALREEQIAPDARARLLAEFRDWKRTASSR